jgi:succinate dehydrogenase cytochrome b556 subunit
MSAQKYGSFVKPRPLSPHLTVYAPQYTSMLSIMHRVTGVFMSVMLVLAVCLPTFATYNFSLLAVFGSQYIQGLPVVFFLTVAVAFSYALAFCYYSFTAFRHLLWDRGIGLDRASIVPSAHFILGLTLVSLIVITFVTVISLW